MNKYKQEYKDIPVPGQFSDVIEPDIMHISHTKRISIIIIGFLVVGYSVVAGTQNSLLPFKTIRNDSDAFLSLSQTPAETVEDDYNSFTTQPTAITFPNLYHDKNDLFEFQYDDSLQLENDQTTSIVLMEIDDSNQLDSSISILSVTEDAFLPDFDSIIQMIIDENDMTIYSYKDSGTYYRQIIFTSRIPTWEIMLSADSEQRLDELQKMIETLNVL